MQDIFSFSRFHVSLSAVVGNLHADILSSKGHRIVKKKIKAQLKKAQDFILE